VTTAVSMNAADEEDTDYTERVGDELNDIVEKARGLLNALPQR
jgi:hypothetical protein